MHVKVWGCRGSLASPGPETVRYGGNTSCVEVRLADGTLIVLDAGTGIRPLGLANSETPAPETVHLLLTHLHIDHLEGLGFYAPVWSPETKLEVWGPPSTRRSLDERIARYLSPPLFPVHLFDIPAQTTFHDTPDDEWEIGGVRVLARPISHPGPTRGYRLSENGRSFAYIPDHEPALGVDLASLEPEWLSGFAIAEGADVLLHDCQFTEEEYRTRTGWGHSSVADAVAFAERADPGRFVLFHHDPLHTDDDLDALLERAGELWNGNGDGPVLAYEGMEFELE